MTHIASHLATVTLLLGASAGCAQITNPDNLVAPAPRNPAKRHAVQPTDDLQWLWTFAQPAPIGRADALRVDARFRLFLESSFKQPQAVWGPANTRESLPTVIPLFLSGYGVVTTAQNRYVTVDGCVPSFCAASGLLWVDVGTPHPLAVFVAVNWNAQAHTIDEPTADYNLWLFPSRTLSADELPLALTQAIAHWDLRLASAHRRVPHIAHALLVEPDGSPFPVDPQMVGANTIAPQTDTLTPSPADEN